MSTVEGSEFRVRLGSERVHVSQLSQHGHRWVLELWSVRITVALKQCTVVVVSGSRPVSLVTCSVVAVVATTSATTY